MTADLETIKAELKKNKKVGEIEFATFRCGQKYNPRINFVRLVIRIRAGAPDMFQVKNFGKLIRESPDLETMVEFYNEVEAGEHTELY